MYFESIQHERLYNKMLDGLERWQRNSRGFRAFIYLLAGIPEGEKLYSCIRFDRIDDIWLSGYARRLSESKKALLSLGFQLVKESPLFENETLQSLFDSLSFEDIELAFEAIRIFKQKNNLIFRDFMEELI